MKLLITGATGYIGTKLRYIAKNRGYEVICLCRRQGAFTADEWLHYDLGDKVPVEVPADAGAVIHLAINSKLTSESDCIAEISAARSLLTATLRSGAKFIFVSSQTANNDAPTMYGRTKWAIEQEVLKAGGWVIRPGQVYGGDEKGLFGILSAAVRSLPVLPAFLPAPYVQPVHVDDLANALLAVAERNDLTPRVFCVAAEQPVTFTCFLALIASERLRVRRFFLPVPTFLIRVATFVLGERVSIKLGIERLVSLFSLPQMQTADDLSSLALDLRSLQSGMRRTTLAGKRLNRRFLAREAKILLAYILKRQPGLAVQARYVRAVELFRHGRPLKLPGFMLRSPLTLALLDDRNFTSSAAGKEFLWRLNTATILAEATTVGAARFIGIGEPSGAIRYGMLIAWSVAMEVMWRLFGIFWLPIYLRRLNSEALK
jgi:nucleoside-diphosphate-sugar epimerase